METNDKFKILAVDDEKLNLNILSDVLKQEYKVLLAKNGEQALSRAKSNAAPDLILLDVMMPEMDGYQVLNHLKSDPETQNIPVIFITALNSAEDEEKGLLAGAVDYISKPFNATVVRARVKTHLTILHQRRLLERKANLDGLTEIPNRRNFENALHNEWGRCRRKKSPLSLIMMDVDCFKQYNDNYGHAAGDDALKKVAKVISYHARRGGDVAARYGGEEFALLLPECDAKESRSLANQVLEELRSLCIPHEFSSACGLLTMSLGGATALPNQEMKPLDLVKKADEMLYLAKREGRNQVAWSE